MESCGGGGAVFCNPPYGREIGKWVRKAWEEAKSGTTIVLLIPARTDTSYFHDYILGHAEIRWVRGRLRFEDEDGTVYGYGKTCQTHWAKRVGKFNRWRRSRRVTGAAMPPAEAQHRENSREK